MSNSDLTPRRHLFALAYVGEAKGNATNAARMAGYKGGSYDALKQTASELMRQPSVRGAIRDWLARSAEARSRAWEVFSREEEDRKLMAIGRRLFKQARRLVCPTSPRIGVPWNAGEACWKARLTVPQVMEIRSRRKSGEKTAPLAKEFGVSAAQISSIASGKYWKSVPFIGLSQEHARGSEKTTSGRPDGDRG